MDKFKPECLPTAIGSLPHKDAAEAVACVMRELPEIPFWPQLPALGYLEGMCPQYAEGMPATHVDAAAGRVWVDTGEALLGEMERFYEKYMSEDLGPFAVSPVFAAAFGLFTEEAAKATPPPVAIKGHTTGPITWGLTVTDQGKRAAIYNDQLKDGIVKGLARKTAWQVRELSKLGRPVIIFIDEPYLQSVGSSFVALQREEVIGAIDEVVDAIHAGGALAGVHCCGNTDWGLIAGTGIDILNFDAYTCAESLALYPQEVGSLIERGGTLAWGIVPATDDLDKEDEDSLFEKLRAAMAGLAGKAATAEKLLECALVTPSCGLGSLTVEQAQRGLGLTRAISARLRGEKK